MNKLKLSQDLSLSIFQSQIYSLNFLMLNNFEINSVIEREIYENPLIEYNYNKDYDFTDYYKENKNNLYEHIDYAITFSKFNNNTKKIMRRLKHYIDSNGYLLDDYLNDNYFKFLNVDKFIIKLQTLLSSGIAARNLSECLLIQYKKQNSKPDKKVIEILEKDLEFIASMDYNYFYQKYNINEKALDLVKESILKLNPRPGLKFDNKDNSLYIIPDIYLKFENEKINIQINSGKYRSIFINKDYKNKDIISTLNKSEIAKFKKMLYSAENLIDAFEKRKKTLEKISILIIQLQKDFFLKGEKHIQALTRKDLSKQLKIHESTISRAVNNKYISFNNKIFKLEDLFSSTIYCIDGRKLSSKYIKYLIKDLIKNENTSKPLTDSAIREYLNNNGIIISTRTVQKYRSEIGYLNYKKRYKYKGGKNA